MATFEDPDYAARFRDAIKQAVAEEVDKLRPPARYGTVSSIDAVNRVCFVLFPGEEEPVPVALGSIVPMYPGQVARVLGKAGDKYLDDVVGRAGDAWRSTTPNLSTGWNVGADGYIKLNYALHGHTCHVTWEILFLGSGIEDGSGEDPDTILEIEMPFMREAGPLVVGHTYGRPSAAGTPQLFTSMMPTANDPWLRLISNAASSGVKAGTPWEIGNYTTFAGSLTYQVSAFHLAIIAYFNADLPGVPL